MTILGLDFDNTLVEYDEIFYSLALEKKLINKEIEPRKVAIRNHLRRIGKEKEFTILQGEIYGNRILEAHPKEGMMKALLELKKKGIEMKLISHKTKYPYEGKRYNLHNAAMSWLEKNGFTSINSLDWQKEMIFFEETKERKINRIIEQNCTYYIDDLEEILDMLPSYIKKIHYVGNREENTTKYNKIKEWNEVIKILSNNGN